MRDMKLLVCGSRSVNDYTLVKVNIDALKPTEIIHGGAIGADTLADIYAIDNDLPKTVIKPDWKMHGKAAGPIRNRQMVDLCDEVLAFWDHASRGTKSTIDYAREVGKPLHIVPVNFRPLAA